jgi:hypothetical protein
MSAGVIVLGMMFYVSASLTLVGLAPRHSSLAGRFGTR